MSKLLRITNNKKSGLSKSVLLWQKWQKRQTDKIAIYTGDQQYTWSELAQLININADNLCQYKISQGMVVCAIAKNSFELLILYLACLQNGIICAFIPPQPISGILIRISQIKSKYFFADDLHASDKNILIAKNYVEINIKLKPDNTNSIYSPLKATINYFNNDNHANIIFTSGSTGTPKAIVHSINNHIYSAKGLLKKIEFSQDDCWMLSLPMFHISGIAIIWRWLLIGAKLKVPNYQKDLLANIKNVTHASLVPTQLQKIINHKLQLKTVLLGGGYIPAELTNKCAKKKINTWVGYGLSECSSTVVVYKVNSERFAKDINPAGEILKHRQIKIINNHIFVGGRVLGMLYQQGKFISLANAQGLYNTFDLGKWIKINNKKYLQIIGRADNMFISGGENIHCEEIEAELLKNKNIVNAFVIPVADSEFGAKSIAIINSKINLQQINFSKTLNTLPKFKHPQAYFPIPKEYCAEGIKISRHYLKKWFFNNYQYIPIKFA